MHKNPHRCAGRPTAARPARSGLVAWLLLASLAELGLGGCTRQAAPAAAAAGEVSASVQRAHQAATQGVDLADPAAFDDARRGLIAAPSGQIRDAAGQLVWDHAAFAFVKGPPPPTVNPSLWRQALLNNHAGLFLVAETAAGRIWQLRGFDIANLTLIEGKTGWIVVDTLTARETAAAAMAFARQHLGDKPVSAIVFTHSHVDHFGGALGVLSAEDARARQVPIVAPVGFMEEATSENLMVGVAMGRRSHYMYGSRLPRDATGVVDNGLGKAVAYGSIGILPPTVLVTEARQELVLDGVRFVFHNVPGSEAPSEFVFALPDFKAFCGAELMSHTLHNLYTLRGAKVRDGLKWAGYLDAALGWAEGAEVLFNQHHWPVWGRARIAQFIAHQRDAYKFIHDQTVRHMNAGRVPSEIAERLVLPPELHKHLSVHGYYGTVSHNVKAVYQHYLGWYDAHPAHLEPHPPVPLGERYVALAGGADKAVAAAQQAFDAGDFRWAAELLKHVVHAQPKHSAAAALLARCFEQMGYAAEAATWRNAYLMGAYELRAGPPEKGMALSAVADMLLHTPIERFLERMAASLDAEKAGDVRLSINLLFSDTRESFRLRVENGVMHHHKAPPAEDAGASLTLTKAFFLRMMTGEAGAKDLLLSDQTKIEGSRIELGRFFTLLEKAPGNFGIVTR